jgi:hypothetical protein
MIHPAPNGLAGGSDAVFRQQAPDVTEAQSEPDMQPDRLLNDQGRIALAGIVDFDHCGG